MKRKYITPGLLIVEIRTNHMLADSLMFRSGNITEESGVLTKEYDNSSVSGKNVWDEEW